MSPCLASPGNVFTGQLHYLAVLHLTTGDHKSTPGAD